MKHKCSTVMNIANISWLHKCDLNVPLSTTLSGNNQLSPSVFHCMKGRPGAVVRSVSLSHQVAGSKQPLCSTVSERMFFWPKTEKGSDEKNCKNDLSISSTWNVFSDFPDHGTGRGRSQMGFGATMYGCVGVEGFSRPVWGLLLSKTPGGYLTPADKDQ